MNTNGDTPHHPDEADHDEGGRDLDPDEIDKLLAALNPQIDPVIDDPFVDWADLWQRERTADDWLLQDVFARGRAHAIYAKHKAGKSLFTLWAAAKLATSPDHIAVVYLDYEMTEDDLRDRLEDMGYGPGHDLSRFHYWLLPTLPPLDTAHGAEALEQILDAVQVQHPDHHLFVVVDTTSRAVKGDENDADTYQDFYRYTGIRLKRRGHTWVRLDHAGKDPAKGQRGSSAKGDDVDLVWLLEPQDNGVVLRRELTRISWAKERSTFAIVQEPLRYVVAAVWLAGTKETADELDELGADPNLSGNKAMTLLRDNDKGRTRAVVLDAVRFRRENAQ